MFAGSSSGFFKEATSSRLIEECFAFLLEGQGLEQGPLGFGGGGGGQGEGTQHGGGIGTGQEGFGGGSGGGQQGGGHAFGFGHKLQGFGFLGFLHFFVFFGLQIISQQH